VLRYSAVWVISSLYVALDCNKRFPPPVSFAYSISTSADGWNILYVVSIFLVFLLIFILISN
jgi:hypothetical protein